MYVYDSFSKIAYAFDIANNAALTFTSPIALASGNYSIKIFSQLVNGGNGNPEEDEYEEHVCDSQHDAEADGYKPHLAEVLVRKVNRLIE